MYGTQDITTLPNANRLYRVSSRDEQGEPLEFLRKLFVLLRVVLHDVVPRGDGERDGGAHLGASVVLHEDFFRGAHSRGLHVRARPALRVEPLLRDHPQEVPKLGLPRALARRLRRRRAPERHLVGRHVVADDFADARPAVVAPVAAQPDGERPPLRLRGVVRAVGAHRAPRQRAGVRDVARERGLHAAPEHGVRQRAEDGILHRLDAGGVFKLFRAV
mmetsp:Transcript_3765/g.15955  ORF Transcript_3765/g.15955 Transcript_3765/m.15955 type:complete len:218 (+) Transcript_3765:368-1021(+)